MDCKTSMEKIEAQFKAWEGESNCPNAQSEKCLYKVCLIPRNGMALWTYVTSKLHKSQLKVEYHMLSINIPKLNKRQFLDLFHMMSLKSHKPLTKGNYRAVPKNACTKWT